MNTSDQVPNSTANPPVPNASEHKNVPNSKASGSNPPVPNASEHKNVPNSKASGSTTELARTSRVIQPRDIPINPFTPPKNQRRYTGQTLKIVDYDGRVTIISEPLLEIALVDGRSRILDRAPWTGLPIQVA